MSSQNTVPTRPTGYASHQRVLAAFCCTTKANHHHAVCNGRSSNQLTIIDILKSSLLTVLPCNQTMALDEQHTVGNSRHSMPHLNMLAAQARSLRARGYAA